MEVLHSSEAESEQGEGEFGSLTGTIYIRSLTGTIYIPSLPGVIQTWKAKFKP